MPCCIDTHLQPGQKVILLTGYTGNDPNDPQNGSKEQSGYLGSLIVGHLHDKAAMLEAVHHVSKVVLANNLHRSPSPFICIAPQTLTAV